MKSQKVEFQLPKDAAVPEGTGEDEFDMVCSFKIGANGQACMTRFGDAEMPGYGDKKEKPGKEDKPGYGDMAQGMMTMQGG
jgi:hypothetical protein